VTSGPDGVLFSRDHLWVRITDGTARVGLTDLDGAALGRLALPVDATVYTCGPRAFMEQIASACRLLGITDVRRESFGSPDAINPGIVGESPIHHPQVPGGTPGDGPLVTFSRSGLSAPWAGQRYASLLEFAEACDVLLCSCQPAGPVVLDM
jgi:hypothetical protein